MKKFISILKKSKLFFGMNDSEIENILPCFSPKKRTYQKGEYIYHYGEKITAMGLVLDGRIHILKEDYWGNRTILAEISEGQLFGEAYACSDKTKLSVSAIAAQDSAVLFFDVPRLLTVCPSACVFHSQLIQNLIAVLAEKNIYLTSKIEYLSQRRLRDKILSYLSDASKRQDNSDFFIPFNRQELADYLSVDRSALSNELCKLREEGILEFKRNHFRLL